MQNPRTDRYGDASACMYSVYQALYPPLEGPGNEASSDYQYPHSRYPECSTPGEVSSKLHIHIYISIFRVTDDHPNELAVRIGQSFTVEMNNQA